VVAAATAAMIMLVATTIVKATITAEVTTMVMGVVAILM